MAADREALYRQTAEELPVGHVGEVEEIAEAYLYLMRQTYGTAQVLILMPFGTEWSPRLMSWIRSRPG
jgi:hypothetical protein